MTDHDRTLLAAFLTQRYEMGEREWRLDPGAVSALFRPGVQVQSQPAKDRHDTAAPEPSPRSRRDSKQHAPQHTTHSAANPATPGDGVATGSAAAVSGPLGELHSAVCECLRCPLGNTRTRFVFGEGNPDADIMFIGEAPGADEDRQGRPFIGRAGQLLTKMIESIKLSREDVYIANILKCRPPGNRDPKPDEIEQCEPILLRQIKLIKPRVICALGRISGQTLLRTNTSLTALRGRVHDYHGVKLIVTYHPAALLRNPNWKRPAWDDLKFLRREYDGLEL